MIWSLWGPNGSQLVETTVWLKPCALLTPMYELGITVNSAKANSSTKDDVPNRIILKIPPMEGTVRI